MLYGAGPQAKKRWTMVDPSETWRRGGARFHALVHHRIPCLLDTEKKIHTGDHHYFNRCRFKDLVCCHQLMIYVKPAGFPNERCDLPGLKCLKAAGRDRAALLEAATYRRLFFLCRAQKASKTWGIWLAHLSDQEHLGPVTKNWM